MKRFTVCTRASRSLTFSICFSRCARNVSHAAAAATSRAGLPATCRFGDDALGVERQQRGEVLLPIADDDRLRHDRDRLEHALDELRRDVLAAGGDEQLLLAIGDAQEAVGVDLADVARVEPAVGVDRLARRRRRPSGSR